MKLEKMQVYFGQNFLLRILMNNIAGYNNCNLIYQCLIFFFFIYFFCISLLPAILEGLKYE